MEKMYQLTNINLFIIYNILYKLTQYTSFKFLSFLSTWHCTLPFQKLNLKKSDPIKLVY